MRVRPLGIVLLLLVLIVGGLSAWLALGRYNIAADVPHTRPVLALLTLVRERSVAWHSRDITPPALDDPALIRAGAGNYAAMCVGCHLAPGVDESELHRGLYPAPPRLDVADRISSPARDFWVIKHGIKASGMPAWGRSMDDRYIWGLTAFLQKLPMLSEAQYRALVATSPGHAHGGGEGASTATPAKGGVHDHHHGRNGKPHDH